MSNSAPGSGQKAGLWLGGAGLVMAHLSGALAGAEHSFWPGLAHAQFNWVHTLSEAPAWKAAATAITQAGKGSDSDRIAAKAACTLLGATYGQTGDHALLASEIKAQVPFEYLGTPGLDGAISAIATKLGAATDPGAFGHVYREACYGIG